MPLVAINDAEVAAVAWDIAARPVVGSMHYPAGPDGWGPVEFVSVTEESRGYEPDLAIDGSGRAVVVWGESVIAADHELWSNTWTPDAGWGSPVPIRQEHTPSTPSVSVNDSGNTVVVWREVSGTDSVVLGSHAEAGTGWTVPTLVQPQDQIGLEPQVAIDPDGNAVAVWWAQDMGSEGAHIWANRFIAGVGWGDAELIDSGTHNYSPRVGIDDDGNAIAIWVQAPIDSQIWANRYEPGAGWSTPERISSEEFNGREPALAVGPSGDAVAVWLQSAGLSSDLWANRYVPGVGWGEPELIDTTSASAHGADVAIDAAGNAMAVWGSEEADSWRVWARTSHRP